MYCYEIGPCPRCGSNLTGRLKLGKEGQKYFMMGSPVIYTADPGPYTCACAKCGVRWVGSGKMVKKSKAQIQDMQEAWETGINMRPDFTMDVESQIADELYYGLQEEGIVVPKEKKDSLLKRFIWKTASDTNKQGHSLIDDFYGLTGSGFCQQDDTAEDSWQKEEW